jgi:hypothetical protein
VHKELERGGFKRRKLEVGGSDSDLETAQLSEFPGKRADNNFSFWALGGVLREG